MSVEAMAWVLRHSSTTGNSRLVLLAIADHADRDGRNAWPSVRTLTTYANVSEATTHRTLRALEAGGHVSIERNMGGEVDSRADRRPNRYTISGVSQHDTPSDLRGLTTASTGSQMTPSRGVTADTRTVLIDPSITRTPRESTANFAEWYGLYPLHKARGEAEKAWRSMNGELPDLKTLLNATRRYADTETVKRGFAKHPATWLRAKCWLDEETNGHGPPMERCPKCDLGWADDSVCFAQGCPMMAAAPS